MSSATEMDRRTGAGGSELHLVLVGLGVGDKFLHVLDAKILARNQHQWGFDDQRHRRKIRRRIVGRLLEQRLVLGLGSDRPLQERVAVGGCLRDPVGAIHPAGAGDVFDDDRLPQDLAHALSEQPRQHVVRPAGCERIDHGERPCRPLLGPDVGRCSQRGEGDERGDDFPHGVLRSLFLVFGSDE